MSRMLMSAAPVVLVVVAPPAAAYCCWPWWLGLQLVLRRRKSGEDAAEGEVIAMLRLMLSPAAGHCCWRWLRLRLLWKETWWWEG